MRWLGSIMDSVDMNLSELQEIVGESGMLQSVGLQRVGHDLMTQQQQHKGKHLTMKTNISMLMIHYDWRAVKCLSKELK